MSCFTLALAAFLSPKHGIFILLIVIPLRTFFIAFNPAYKVIGDILIVALLLRTIINHRKDLKSLVKFQLWEYALFAFFAVGIVSALLTGVDLVPIIFQVRAYILFYLLYYIVKRLNFDKSFVKLAVTTTFGMAVVLSIHGLIEVISIKTFLIPYEWYEWYWTTLSNTNFVRSYGLIKGPNELALYLLIAFLLSLYLLKVVSKKQTYFVYAGLTIIGTTFLLTYSRGAFLALAVFFVGYLILYRSLKGLLPLVITAALSFLLFIGVGYASSFYEDYYYANLTNDYGELVNPNPNKLSDEGKKRLSSAFSEDTIGLSAADGRLYYVKKAIEVAKDHPIIGTGFATFGGAATLSYSSPIYEDYDIRFNFYSDNQYILTLAETGILGVLILTVFILGILIFTIKTRKKIDPEVTLMLFFMFVTMMVGGLVYNILEIDSFMMYYFLLLGFAHQQFKGNSIEKQL